MKKLLLFICAAMMIFSCVKEKSVKIPIIDPIETKLTWATTLKSCPFLDGFPVFDGEINAGHYEKLGSMETLTCFDYDCDKSVSTTYYAKFIPAGFISDRMSAPMRPATARILSNATQEKNNEKN